MPAASPPPPRPRAWALSRVAATLFAAVPFVTPGAPAAAVALQPAAQGVVAGTVVTQAAQRPVADAQIVVEGTALGVSTDASGRFRIAGVSGATVRLTVRRIGYQPATVTARVGATDIVVALTERVLELNQVVVTGTAGVAERRAVGNAVSQISAAEITATQPVRNFQDLLTGRAAGVSVVGSSGQVGAGSRIRVRGASSLSLANDPLIYVDGIRVDNTQASGPTNQAFGSRSVSRWNDFDPDDIESIEIIKGPAAATLYGTEASNGVIQIITKKGAAGRTLWNFTTRHGANWLPNWRERLYTNYASVPRVGGAAGARDTVTITPSQLNDSLRANFGNDIFRTGRLQDYQLSLGGGAPAFRYYVGGNYEENQGVERVNGLRRTSLRANVSATPGQSYDLQASLGYTSGRTNIPLESGGGGTTWATYFASPNFLAAAGNPVQLGFRSGPPDIYYQAYRLFQDADRFTGSVTLNHRPASWLNHRLILGVDRLTEDDQEIAARNDVLGTRYASFSSVGPTTGGYLAIGTRDATNSTFDYAANATFGFGAWRSVTSVGGQYYGRRTVVRDFYGENFPAAGLVALNAAAVQRLQRDDIIENNTVGGFVQEQLIWKDRLFLTGAVRSDDNSSFGTNYDVVTYPKLSASYVLSEEPALRLPSAVNTLRLRAAYGASGLQPGAFDAIRTYVSGGGVVTPLSAGNPNLGPERSYELEMGADAGLFDDRVGLDVTYFSGTTRDAILSRQAPPSEGFPGLQFFNAGRVDRNGVEMVVRAQPVRRQRVTLDLTLSGSTNGYEIVDLGPGTDRVSLSGQLQHVVGYAPGAWWDRRVVAAQKDASGRVVGSSLQCDDGRGGQVACASAPRVFLGNSVPTREGSASATLTLFRDLRVTAFVDHRGGYKKLDGNRRVRCNLFSLCRENYYPNEFDAVTLAEVQNGTAYTYNLIQDATFTRFRELAVTYALPQRLARSLNTTSASFTLAGRNLGLWTDYPGLEPEASFNSGSRGAAFGQWEQNVLPQTRQFVATLNLSF